ALPIWIRTKFQAHGGLVSEPELRSCPFTLSPLPFPFVKGAILQARDSKANKVPGKCIRIFRFCYPELNRKKQERRSHPLRLSHFWTLAPGPKSNVFKINSTNSFVFRIKFSKPFVFRINIHFFRYFPPSTDL